MTGGESALLRAVRSQLQTALAKDQYAINIEPDEQAPATTAQKYIAIVPGGFRPGQRHDPGGGVWDFLFSVEVSVVLRITNVPRDRERDAFMFFLESMSSLCDAVITAIDFNYAVTTTANSLLATEQPGTAGFHHPLVFRAIDAKPRVVRAEIFGAKKDERAGLARKITFDQANRIVVRT